MSNEGVFDEDIGGFCCNFGESVKEPSAINMQLMKSDGDETKVGQASFMSKHVRAYRQQLVLSNPAHPSLRSFAWWM